MMQNSTFLRHRKITAEYIRGLTDGEGCFTFCKAGAYYIPTFVISMHERDEKLFIKVADFLNLKSDVHIFNAYLKDGHKRGRSAKLIVRDTACLVNIIVPLFYKKLLGYKADQFEAWIKKIGSDTMVPKRYKSMYELYESGYWDKKENYIHESLWVDIS
jgi:hypothetical protein